MKTSILAVFLTFGLVATVQATDFSDVGPASLFYDFNGSDVNEMDYATASPAPIIQRDKGVVYSRTNNDDMLDNDHHGTFPSQENLIL